MTAYRAGQRVRIEWPDGSAVKGVMLPGLRRVRYGGVRFWHEVDAMAAESQDGATITVLSEPRPDEPTGMGAVVRAGIRGWDSRIWVRTFSGRWVTDEVTVDVVDWSDLIDPVVLSEGWIP